MPASLAPPKSLLPASVQFHANPAAYTHFSHIKDMYTALAACTIPSLFMEAFLRRPSTSRKIFRRFDLSMEGFYDFSTPNHTAHLAWRLALMPPALLQDCAVKIGMVAFAPVVRFVVEKKDVQTLLQLFGRASYLVGVERARFMPPWPHVVKVPGDFMTIARYGTHLLHKFIEPAPLAVRRRFSLKFPESFLSSAHEREDFFYQCETMTPTLWNRVLDLIEEFYTPWKPLLH